MNFALKYANGFELLSKLNGAFGVIWVIFSDFSYFRNNHTFSKKDIIVNVQRKAANLPAAHQTILSKVKSAQEEVR